jgi:hypothetical protein
MSLPGVVLLGPNERIRNETFTAQSFWFSPMSSLFFYRFARLSRMVPADNKSDDPDRIDRLLSHISLFFRLRSRPGPAEDHTLCRQQTLGSSAYHFSLLTSIIPLMRNPNARSSTQANLVQVYESTEITYDKNVVNFSGNDKQCARRLQEVCTRLSLI